MKPKKLILLIFLSLFTIAIQAQSRGIDTIPWHDDLKLTWADFKGAPDNSSAYDAYTDYLITFNYSYTSLGARISVRLANYFDRDKSWVKKDKEKDSLLMHEKGHFAIAEIYARKARKIITDTVILQSNVTDILQGVYSRIVKECSNREAQYDDETQHSKITAKQIEWLQEIYSELDGLKAYLNPVVEKSFQ